MLNGPPLNQPLPGSLTPTKIGSPLAPTSTYIEPTPPDPLISILKTQPIKAG